MEDLSVVLRILSAMITPAILIMAAGSLLLTTSQRLSRSIDRTRKISEMFDRLAKKTDVSNYSNRVEYLFHQLKQAVRRSRILQQAMAALYLSVSVFIATSFFIGIVEITKADLSYVPLGAGLMGASLLFYASILLIIESRITINSINHEMKNTLMVSSSILKAKNGFKS